MAWTFDMPSGTFKNHALSTDIRREVIADAVFMKFARAEPGFGKNKGESVTITRILQLPVAGRVGEMDALPSGRPAISTKQVRISQWGFKIPTTQLEKDLTHFNLMNEFQRALRDQMTMTMDKMVADAFKLAAHKYVPTVAGQTITTNGVAGATATRNLGIQDLRKIHDDLKGTYKVPPYRNGKYVGILSTNAARGIKNDPEYKDWLAPTDSSPFLTGRLKDVEGFMLIESNATDSLDNTVGASTTTGEAVFFGADSVGLLQIQTPELRAGLPDELGTHQDIGWVGTIEAFLVWDQATMGRVYHVTSL